MKKVTTEFCFNKLNALPSEYLLRQIIKTTLDLDDRYNVSTRSQLERMVGSSDRQEED